MPQHALYNGSGICFHFLHSTQISSPMFTKLLLIEKEFAVHGSRASCNVHLGLSIYCICCKPFLIPSIRGTWDEFPDHVMLVDVYAAVSL